MRVSVSIALLLFATALLFGCERADTQGEYGTNEAGALPTYSLKGVTHFQYENGILRQRVDFDQGDYYEDLQELRIENCRFVYYDCDGTVVSRGHSKKANLFIRESRLVAEEDVVIVSEVNRGRLETDYLEWQGDESRFVTEEFVTITRYNGDILQGIGMITDVALNYVTIKSDVKGSFQTE
jgi:LPS export ABC transporter protein LptC